MAFLVQRRMNVITAMDIAFGEFLVAGHDQMDVVKRHVILQLMLSACSGSSCRALAGAALIWRKPVLRGKAIPANGLRPAPECGVEDAIEPSRPTGGAWRKYAV
jgi:hypothetical protein